MANEILFTGDSDSFLTETLNARLHMLMYDKSDLRRLCLNLSDGQRGALQQQIAQWNLGDAMAAANTNETTAVSNTALTTASVTVTVARQAIARTVSDVRITASVFNDLDILASQVKTAAVLRFTDMLAALFPSLATNVNDTGVAFTVDTVFSGIRQMTIATGGGVPGGWVCVLHPKQYADLVDSLRGEGGALQWLPATAEHLTLRGPGYKGSLLGVEIYTSDSVPTSGSDYVGAMFGAGCFGYREMSTPVPSGMGSGISQIGDQGSPIWVEFQRKPAEGHTLLVGNYYVGVTEIEDLRGVKLTSAQ